MGILGVRAGKMLRVGLLLFAMPLLASAAPTPAQVPTSDQAQQSEAYQDDDFASTRSQSQRTADLLPIFAIVGFLSVGGIVVLRKISQILF
jgi:hypothetical protein